MYAVQAGCGGYAATAMYGGTYRDAIIIQSLVKNTAASGALPYSNVCGQSGFDTAAASAAVTTVGQTVCCKYFNQQNL